MGKKDTDIHKPDGFIFGGEKIGHGDEQRKIRKADGAFSRGEEMGYIDSDGKIRRKDGVFLRGDEIGQITDNKAHDTDGGFFNGEEWGYVDEQGNVRQKDGVIFRGRIIGKMKGKNTSVTLGFYVLRFKEMEDNFNKLENTVRSEENKAYYLGKVQHMLGYVQTADALGDFDGLIHRLKRLERDILNYIADNRGRKEDIIRKAQTISRSTNWKVSADELVKLQEEWQKIRSAGRDHDEELWQRFRSAKNDFHRHRTEHFEKNRREEEGNNNQKERLCSDAESLIHSSDTKAAIDRVKQLQAEWNTIGHVPRDKAELLRNRFRNACDLVFQNARKQRERQQEEWRAKMKETLSRKCEQAISLRKSIEHDEENIERWKNTIYGLHDGGRADEIRRSLESKISDVEDTVSSKKSRLRDLEESIKEIERKL